MRARRMSPRWLAAAVLLALVLVPAGVAAGERMGRRQATLRDTHGVAVGQVRLEDRGGGRTRVRVRAWGLSPGYHGFHIHAVGVCDPDAVDPATGRVRPSSRPAATTSHPRPRRRPAGAVRRPPWPARRPSWSRSSCRSTGATSSTSCGGCTSSPGSRPWPSTPGWTSAEPAGTSSTCSA